MDQVRASIGINMEFYLNMKEIGLELEVELVSFGHYSGIKQVLLYKG